MSQPDILNSDQYSTQSYNRYAYVKNNPLKYIDPSGYVDVGHMDAAMEDRRRTFIKEFTAGMDYVARWEAQSQAFSESMYSLARRSSGTIPDQSKVIKDDEETLEETGKEGEGGGDKKGEDEGVKISANDLRLFEKAMTFGSVSTGIIQLGMINNRQSLSLFDKVGTFAKFSSNYRAVGRFGGRLSIIGAVTSVSFDISDYSSGEIGGARLSYRFGSLVTSLGYGYVVGGPPGALGAFVITGISMMAEYSYDNGIVPMWNVARTGYNNAYNGLNNGWKPRF